MRRAAGQPCPIDIGLTSTTLECWLSRIAALGGGVGARVWDTAQCVKRRQCRPGRRADLAELSPAVAGDAEERASRRGGDAGCSASTGVGHVLRIVWVDARRDSHATVATNDGNGS